jgi:hypothetical protein
MVLSVPVNAAAGDAKCSSFVDLHASVISCVDDDGKADPVFAHE